MTFAEAIRRSGFTDEAFAEKVGISHRALVSYKYGERRPRPEVMDKIGKALNIPRDELWDMFYN